MKLERTDEYATIYDGKVPLCSYCSQVVWRIEKLRKTKQLIGRLANDQEEVR